MLTKPSSSLSDEVCRAEESGASGVVPMPPPAPASMSNAAGLPYICAGKACPSQEGAMSGMQGIGKLLMCR